MRDLRGGAGFTLVQLTIYMAVGGVVILSLAGVARLHSQKTQLELSRLSFSETALHFQQHLFNSELCTQALSGQPFNPAGFEPVEFNWTISTPLAVGSEWSDWTVTELGIEPLYIIENNVTEGDLWLARVRTGFSPMRKIAKTERTEHFDIVIQQFPHENKIMRCGSKSVSAGIQCQPPLLLVGISAEGSPICGLEPGHFNTSCGPDLFLVGIDSSGDPICVAPTQEVADGLRQIKVRPKPSPMSPPDNPPGGGESPALPPPVEDSCETGPFVKVFSEVKVYPNKGYAVCPWGVDDNLTKADGRMRARLEINYSESIPKPAGKKLCKVNKISTEGTVSLMYDDHMLLAVNGALLTSSINMTTVGNAGFPIITGGFRKFDWMTVRDESLAGPAFAKPTYQQDRNCGCGADNCCKFPLTEKTGPFEMQLLNGKESELAKRIANDGKIEIKVILTGDNDSGSDCQFRTGSPSPGLPITFHMEYEYAAE